MSFTPNQAGYAQLKKQAAMALLRIATIFQANEKAEWQAGPPRSQPGEHLKMDTGNARDNLYYVPTSPGEVVVNDLEVYVGYRHNAWYAPEWERRQDAQRRRGLPDKLEEFVKSGLTAGIMSSYTG